MCRIALIAMLALGLAACNDTALEPGMPGHVRFTILSGDGQVGRPYTELPDPLVVLAERDGKPWKKQIVNFVVTDGGGWVFAGSALTDNKGTARDYWTLGSAGAQELQVRAVDSQTGEKLVFATFTATAVIPRTSVVQGTVVVDGGGVPGVTVTLYGTESAVTTTGPEGIFQFAGLLAGGFTVTISGWPADYEFDEVSQGISLTEDDVAVVEFHGRAITTSSGWQAVHLPGEYAYFTEVWGTSASDVFVGGARNDYEGVMLHFDGTEWVEQPLPAGTGLVTSIWGLSPTEVYAVAGTRVLRLEGNEWTRPWENDMISEGFNAIWGTSSDNLYVAGSTVVYKLSGTKWVKEQIPEFDGYIRSITGFGSDLVVAVGTFDGTDGTTEDPKGFILEGRRGSWELRRFDHPFVQDGGADVWLFSATSGIAIGDSGTAARLIDQSWVEIDIPDTPPFSPLTDMWAQSETYFVFVGNYYTMADGVTPAPRFTVWDGTAFTEQAPPDFQIGQFHGVWGTSDANTIYAVGARSGAHPLGEGAVVFRRVGG